MTVQPNLSLLASQKKVLGHGEFKYQVDPSWGNLDPAKVPVECREIVSNQIDTGLSFQLKVFQDFVEGLGINPYKLM
jgi:hypothetical protein